MWIITTTLLAILTSIWLWWRKRNFSYFKNLGIPGPEPSIFFGNFPELRKNSIASIQEWKDKYGKVFGYFHGASPVLVVADTDLLKKIQISDFQKFINRPRIFEVGKQNKAPGDGFSSQLTNVRDKRWKEIRSTLTPSFTTSKMKLMAPIMNSGIDSLMENIKDEVEKDEPFDIYPLYQKLTMDVIGRTAFGIQTDCQRNPSDSFLEPLKHIFAADYKRTLFLLSYCFPEFAFLIQAYIVIVISLFFFGKHPIKKLVNSVRHIVDTRRDGTTPRRQDLLQLLIDAEISLSGVNVATAQDMSAGEEASSEKMKRNETKGNAGTFRPLSGGEIVDNSVLFFLAGYETTSTTLAFATHFLLHYPEVQERIRNEVDNLLEREGELSYTSVHQLQYLDQVMSETLRYYPPIYSFVNREAGESLEVDGLNIPKGVTIQVPVYALQHDEDHWSDPESFDPERFSSENKRSHNPMAFQAFGAGPRNCVGMRFAQMEFKLALARILHNYRLTKCEKTDQHPITLQLNIITMTPKNGIYLKAEKLH